ncbi:DoxX family protein [Enhygromyxa salina]|uniref:DoxX family protein n=1 Tax=Enhygromyxa salina TaxID=215803 RepID=UPI0015E7A878|nr:DoxX family protein [Enhygromyxa salina]
MTAGLLAALFVLSGGFKLAGMLDDQFREWGYTRDVTAIIGILELAGAVGLLFKRTAGWTAVGLSVIVAGLIWTLAIRDQYMLLIAPVAVLVLLLFVAWGRGLYWSTKGPGEIEVTSTAATVEDPHDRHGSRVGS